jgi:hypothetical protein
MIPNRASALSLLLLAAAACAQSEAPAPETPGAVVAGWYMQRDGRHLFQACEHDTPRQIEPSKDLIAKARAFGVEEDLPVYAKLVFDATGARTLRVEQFGSDVPVTGCAMNGVVVPADEGD